MKDIRDQILEGMCKHDQDPFGVDMSGKRKISVDKAVNDLIELMCYREIRAYWKAFLSFNEDDFYTGIEEEIKGEFIEDYPELLITAAIEQYKSEQK